MPLELCPPNINSAISCNSLRIISLYRLNKPKDKTPPCFSPLTICFVFVFSKVVFFPHAGCLFPVILRYLREKAGGRTNQINLSPEELFTITINASITFQSQCIFAYNDFTTLCLLYIITICKYS